MSRPRLLDLFCGAGGCSVGYARAGFDVTGVDIEAHPDYPYPMIVGDAMTVLDCPAVLRAFDVVHASPPCQGYTTMSNKHPDAQAQWPKLLEPCRSALEKWGGLYVIENVEGARRDMRSPFRLMGSHFGLAVHRARLFESNAFVMVPSRQAIVSDVVGVYGDKPDGRWLNERADGTRQYAASSLEQAQAAMGIDWMGWDDLREAIPPAYTQFIGEQLIDQITRQDVA